MLVIVREKSKSKIFGLKVSWFKQNCNSQLGSAQSATQIPGFFVNLMTTIKIELKIFLVYKVILRFILFSTINAGKPQFITLHHVMKIITDCVCAPQTKTQMNFDVICNKN